MRTYGLPQSLQLGLWQDNQSTFLFLFPEPKYRPNELKLSSVHFSHSVVSDSLQPHGLQNARPPCPSPTPGFTQTHVQWVGDAIQPSHPLLSPSPPTFNLAQHQGLFEWVSSLHQVAKVLEFQPMNIQDWFPLGWTGWISLQSKRLSKVLSNPIFQKHSSALSFLYSPTFICKWLLEKP